MSNVEILASPKLEHHKTRFGALAHQHVLEELFHRKQLMPALLSWLQELSQHLKQQHGTSLEELFKSPPDGLQAIPEEMGFQFLAQLAIHKRATMETLVGILRHHYVGAKEANPSQACARDILRLHTFGTCYWDSVRTLFIVRWDTPARLQHEIDCYQFPLPLIIVPRTLHKNTDSGYLTIKTSVLLKDNYHPQDICLDHLNTMNRIPLTINWDVVNHIQNQWKNLDKPKEGENENDWEKRKKAFNKYDTNAHLVMSFVLKHDNRFYLNHNYDKRGRTYCQGYYVNYQGPAWNKAVIELSDQEIIHDL